MTVGALCHDCNGRPLFPGDRVVLAPGLGPVHIAGEPPWTIWKTDPDNAPGEVVLLEKSIRGNRLIASPHHLKKIKRDRSGYEAASGSMEEIVAAMKRLAAE